MQHGTITLMQTLFGPVLSSRTIAATFVVLVSCISGGASGQEAMSQSDELRALVDHLELIQQANLGIAQEIAAVHVSAAEAIRSAAAAGAFTEEAAKLEALAIAENSATLAVVVLAPIGTRSESRSEPFLELLRQNIARLDALIGRTTDDSALSVLRDVHASQLDTEAMFGRLDDSWADYDDALRRAELAGTLSVGAFDPRRRHWEFASRAGAAEPRPDEFAHLPPLPQEVAATAPTPANEADIATAGTDRWVVTTDRNGLPAATAINLDERSRALLSSITIGCNSDGTLKYQVEGDGALTEIAIVFGDTQRAFVAVNQGAVVGGQALRMSDSLRLAYEWAAAEQSSTMAIGSASAPDIVAAIPVANYYEARGAVLDSCVPHEAGIGTVDRQNSDESDVAPIPFPRPRDRMPVGS